MKVKINTHGNALPEVHGEWIDLCTAEDVTLDFLEYKIISLGVSIDECLLLRDQDFRFRHPDSCLVNRLLLHC